MNEQGQETQSERRSVLVLAFGDTAEEIELHALVQGHAFFGEGVPLTLAPYSATSDDAKRPENTEGKTFGTRVAVRANLAP